MSGVRMVAGAPVKHARMPISVTPIGPGMWREVYEHRPDIIVCDLTSPLWRFVEPPKPK